MSESGMDCVPCQRAEEFRERIADAMGCEPDDDANLVEAVRLLVQERDEARDALALRSLAADARAALGEVKP